jgi:hypothetical protein
MFLWGEFATNPYSRYLAISAGEEDSLYKSYPNQQYIAPPEWMFHGPGGEPAVLAPKGQ